MSSVTAGFAPRAMFESLRIRNYRIFFATQVVSVTGTWMQSIAQMWLVLHLTGSGVALGVTAALQFLPVLLFGFYGGLVADRGDKRRILLATQSAAGFIAIVLAAATLSGRVQVWMVFALALLLGCVNAFDQPARQSFVMELVGAAHLSNAVSLNSAVFTGARVLGPAIAGLAIAAIGTGWCFLFNGVSYLPVVVGLLLMRPGELRRGARVARAPGQLVEGLRYAWGHRELRLPLLLMAVVGTLAFNFSVLLPLMARYDFGSGASTYGTLMSVMGIGAFAGALAAAARRRPTHVLVAGAALAFGAMLLLAAGAPSLLLEMAVLVPTGVAMTTFQASANSVLQLNSSPALRGRVISLYVTVFVGTTPIGAPIVGWIAQQFGARAGLALGGAATLVAAAIALIALRRHPIPGAPEEAAVGLPGGASVPAVPVP